MILECRDKKGEVRGSSCSNKLAVKGGETSTASDDVVFKEEEVLRPKQNRRPKRRTCKASLTEADAGAGASID